MLLLVTCFAVAASRRPGSACLFHLACMGVCRTILADTYFCKGARIESRQRIICLPVSAEHSALQRSQCQLQESLLTAKS